MKRISCELHLKDACIFVLWAYFQVYAPRPRLKLRYHNNVSYLTLGNFGNVATIYTKSMKCHFKTQVDPVHINIFTKKGSNVTNHEPQIFFSFI